MKIFEVQKLYPKVVIAPPDYEYYNDNFPCATGIFDFVCGCFCVVCRGWRCAGFVFRKISVRQDSCGAFEENNIRLHDY